MNKIYCKNKRYLAYFKQSRYIFQNNIACNNFFLCCSGIYTFQGKQHSRRRIYIYTSFMGFQKMAYGRIYLSTYNGYGAFPLWNEGSSYGSYCTVFVGTYCRRKHKRIFKKKRLCSWGNILCNTFIIYNDSGGILQCGRIHILPVLKEERQ